MCNELMNFKYQVESEAATWETSKEKISIWLSNYPRLLDALFELTYFTGKAKEIDSPEGYFYTFGHNILLRFPYSIRATSILIENGFYFEAISLIRNLYESFFQLRYFHQHQDKINMHVVERRVKIKTMFENIAPGFYTEIYGKQLSEFAHGGFASAIFRMHNVTTEGGEIIMGNMYDELRCTYLLTLVVPVVYGILNYTPILFPQYLTLAPVNTEIKRREAVAWLEKVMRDHIAEKPTSKKFYDLVHPLIH